MNFVTAFDSFAIEAFEAHALDYLLKPVDDRRLQQAIERAAWLIDLQQREDSASALRDLPGSDVADASAPAILNSICVRSTRRIERIQLAEIEWIASAGNYVKLHLDCREILHRATPIWIEQRQAPDEFTRVHRKHIERNRCVRELRSTDDGQLLLMHSGDREAASPRHLVAARQLLIAAPTPVHYTNDSRGD